MLLVFHGDNRAEITQQIGKLKDRYLEKAGSDLNFSRIDANDEPVEKLLEQLQVMPFLASSRLVIAENYLTKSPEKVIDAVTKKSPDVILALVEEKLDSKLARQLTGAKVLEFKSRTGIGLIKWIKEYVEKKGGKISPMAEQLLIDYVGEDQLALRNEIDKLISYNQDITGETIQLLITPRIEVNIFELIDAITARNAKKALKLLYELLDSEGSELQLLSMIRKQYRNVMVAKDSGFAPPELASEMSIHPYVAKKSVEQARHYDLDELKNIYRQIADIDYEVKLGKEPKLLLTRFVAGVCN